MFVALKCLVNYFWGYFSHLQKKKSKNLLCGNGKGQLSRSCSYWKILHKYCIFRVLYTFFHIAVSLYAKWLNTVSTSYGSVVAAAPLSTRSTWRLSVISDMALHSSLACIASPFSEVHSFNHGDTKYYTKVKNQNCYSCVLIALVVLIRTSVNWKLTLQSKNFELASKLLMCKIFCS